MRSALLAATAASLFLLAASPGRAQAQDTPPPPPPPPESPIITPPPPPAPEFSPVAFGLQGGVDFSNPRVNDLGYSSGNWRNGIAGGVSLDFAFVPGFGLATGAYYVQRRARPTYTDVNGILFDTDWRLDYVVVPLVFKAMFGPGPVRPYIFAGGNVGFLVRARGDVGNAFGLDAGSFDVKSAFKNTDWAVEGGVGLRFDVAPHVGITVEGTYSHGLTNVVDQGTTFGAGSWKSRDILALGGVQFGF